MSDDWRLKVYARDGGASEGTRRKPNPAIQRRTRKIQGGKCLYCQLPIGTRVRRNGKPLALVANWDHFVPFAYLAQNPDANWVLACQVCNGIKSQRILTSVEEARVLILARRIAKGYEPPEETLGRLKPQKAKLASKTKSLSMKPPPRARVPAPRPSTERTRPKGAVSHGCGAWWTGNRRSHCPACCQTFATERVAQLHRVDSEPGRVCLAPERVGLVLVPHPWGEYWEKPKP